MYETGSGVWAGNYLLAKGGLLLGSVDTLEVANAILAVEFDADTVPETRRPTIERTGLDAGHVGHDLELRVEAGTAVGAEEVFVDLARVTDDIISFRGALRWQSISKKRKKKKAVHGCY